MKKLNLYKIRVIKVLKYLFLFFLIIEYKSYAIDKISIERGYINKIPIAINKFQYNENSSENLGNNILNVIKNDLRLSNIFNIINDKYFIDKTIGITHKPFFHLWRQIDALVLLNTEIIRLPSGKFKITFILWDNSLQKALSGEMFEISEHLWRRVAHKISNKIYEKITGNIGFFDTKILYIAEKGNFLKKTKQIAIMDYDGANHKFLTDGKNLVLTPTVSPKLDKILYLSYINKNKAQVYIQDIKSNKKQLISNVNGMSFSPRFSPNGQKALISIAKSGSTNIYEIDLNTKTIVQLTNSSGVINTSPSYSPDGRKIVFNSDRSGTRQLYIMDSNGLNIKRITFGEGSYAAPAWSPKGDYITFTKISSNLGLGIGVIKIADIDTIDNAERILTTGYIVEGPCWAPNGRIIMYSRSWPNDKNISGKTKLYTIDINGHNEREINTPLDASDPYWFDILD